MNVSACSSGQIWWCLSGLCCLYFIIFTFLHDVHREASLENPYFMDVRSVITSCSYARRSVQKNSSVYSKPNQRSFIFFAKKFLRLGPTIHQINCPRLLHENPSYKSQINKSSKTDR